MSERNKRCTGCEEWKPATTEHFYAVKSRGRTHNKFGEPYLRARCRLCELDRHREWSERTKRRQSAEERSRYLKMDRARRRAYRRLAAINEEGFKRLYAEELRKEGIRLEFYSGPKPREDTDRARLNPPR